MNPGVSFVREVVVHRVKIVGRGGDSVHDEYFVDRDTAVLATAVDGRNVQPEAVTAYQFSDGTLTLPPRTVILSEGPTEEVKVKLLNDLTPAQRILLGRR